jgi:hypothetical protein
MCVHRSSKVSTKITFFIALLVNFRSLLRKDTTASWTRGRGDKGSNKCIYVYLCWICRIIVRYGEGIGIALLQFDPNFPRGPTWHNKKACHGTKDPQKHYKCVNYCVYFYRDWEFPFLEWNIGRFTGYIIITQKKPVTFQERNAN